MLHVLDDDSLVYDILLLRPTCLFWMSDVDVWDSEGCYVSIYQSI